MSILVPDVALELESEQRTLNRRRMCSYHRDFPRSLKYCPHHSLTSQKVRAPCENEIESSGVFCYMSSPVRSQTVLGSCLSEPMGHNRCIPVSCIKPNHKYSDVLKRDPSRELQTSGQSTESATSWKRSFHNFPNSETTSSKKARSSSLIRKIRVRQCRIPTGTTDDDIDEDDEDSSVPDSTETPQVIKSTADLKLASLRLPTSKFKPLSVPSLQAYDAERTKVLPSCLSESRNKNHRLVTSSNKFRRRRYDKRRSTRDCLKTRYLQSSRIYQRAHVSLKSGSTTSPDNPSDPIPTLERKAGTGSSYFYVESPRQQQVKPNDWDLPHNNSECQNKSGKSIDKPDTRLRRLFFVQFIFLSLFFLAVFGGIAVHRAKALQVRKTLNVTFPHLNVSNYTMDNMKSVKLSLGNMLAIDIINNMRSNPSIFDVESQVKAPRSVISEYSNNTSNDNNFKQGNNMNNNFDCEEIRSSNLSLFKENNYTCKKLSRAYFNDSNMCSWQEHMKESSFMKLEAFAEEKSCVSLSSDTLQKAVNFIAPKHPITRQFIKSVCAAEQDCLHILPEVHIFSFDEGPEVVGLLNATILITVSTFNFSFRKNESFSTIAEDNEYFNSQLKLALEKILFQKVAWDVHTSKLGSSIIYPSTQRNDKLSAVLELFDKSYGFLTPRYFLHSTLYHILTSAIVYPLFLLCWAHSFFSPQPVTVVHFPRLAILYTSITAYRIIVLYTIGGAIESNIPQKYYGGDFSDTMVHYLALGLLLTTEIVAAECSHPPVFHKGNWLWRTIRNGTKTNIEYTPLVKRGKLPLYFVYVYATMFWCAVCYCSFYTAAFYHTRGEIILGCLIGFIGLYIPFWVIFSCGCVQMDQVGILQNATTPNSWA